MWWLLYWRKKVTYHKILFMFTATLKWTLQTWKRTELSADMKNWAVVVVLLLATHSAVLLLTWGTGDGHRAAVIIGLKYIELMIIEAQTQSQKKTRSQQNTTYFSWAEQTVVDLTIVGCCCSELHMTRKFEQQFSCHWNTEKPSLNWKHWRWHSYKGSLLM